MLSVTLVDPYFFDTISDGCCNAFVSMKLSTTDTILFMIKVSYTFVVDNTYATVTEFCLSLPITAYGVSNRCRLRVIRCKLELFIEKSRYIKLKSTFSYLRIESHSAIGVSYRRIVSFARFSGNGRQRHSDKHQLSDSALHRRATAGTSRGTFESNVTSILFSNSILSVAISFTAVTDGDHRPERMRKSREIVHEHAQKAFGLVNVTKTFYVSRSNFCFRHG